jgi:tetratricopeptide (TPR) repeat protein
MTINRPLALLLALALLAPITASAQVRGESRITGKVVDEKGQPIADVAVRATKAGESEAVEAKTNNKGDFTLAQLASGEWTVEFSKDGYDPQSGKVPIPEGTASRNVNVTLVVKQVDPNIELQAELKRAEGMMRAGQYADARKVYEDLLAKHPTVHQLHRFVAAAYAGEKNYPKATEHVRALLEKDPGNVENKMLLADMLIEQGQNDEGLALLKEVNVAEVKDPFPFINGAIALIRGGKAEEAIAMLNPVVARFPTQPELYYYRGRAYVSAKKLPEGKADIEKFVAMAPPTAQELGDAKKILEQLKDIK